MNKKNSKNTYSAVSPDSALDFRGLPLGFFGVFPVAPAVLVPSFF